MCGAILYRPVSKPNSNTNRQPIENFDPALPNSLEAERSVLGAIVLNDGALLNVLPILRREDFFLQQHKTIFSHMEALLVSNQPIDSITLMESLSRSKELERAGGVAYLSQLADGLPRVTNVEYYAKIVKQKAALRALIYAARDIQQTAFAAQVESSDIVEGAVQTLLSLEGGSGEAKIREWLEISRSAVDQIKAARNDPKSLFRGRFGIDQLDERTAGLRKKELALVVGPTGNGKSLLALQLAMTCDTDGAKGIIFSAEMSAESIALRELAYDADVFFYYLRRPETLDAEKLSRIEAVASRNRNIAIVDSGITPARVWALAEARKRSSRLDYVIVDYDQLVVEAGLDPDMDEGKFFAHQSSFIHGCVKCAKRLDVCFVLLAQLRKMPPNLKNGGRPTLDDIYGAAAMRNDPDTVIWILRDFFLKNMDKKYEKKARACVVKARNGATGVVKLAFDPQRVRFTQAPSDDPDVWAEESEEQTS